MPGFRMKLFDCKVRLAGQNEAVVPKHGLTIAELAVLKHMHGPNSIVDTFVSTPPVRNNVHLPSEMDRLRMLYNKPNDPVVDKLFPGAFPRLPTSLRDLGIMLYAPPVELPPELGVDSDLENDQEEVDDLPVGTLPTPKPTPVARAAAPDDGFESYINEDGQKVVGLTKGGHEILETAPDDPKRLAMLAGQEKQVRDHDSGKMTTSPQAAA